MPSKYWLKTLHVKEHGVVDTFGQSKELDLHSSTNTLLAFSSAESHIHKYVNVSFRTSFVVADVVVAQCRDYCKKSCYPY